LAGELRQGAAKNSAPTLSEPSIGSPPTFAEVAPRTIHLVRSRLLPVLFVLYVVAFLDRINIGFAALTMNRELGISSQQFGFLVGVFFFGYCLFEIPSNLLLHRIGARIWIARILLSWGVVAVLTGFVRSVSELYVARFLLGIGEAGFFPGIVLYLTYWFPQRERARAIAFFMTAQPITSILGAPFSGIILDHVHWLGLSSWRWLLILEGIPALIGGVAAYRLLPNRPADATFLSTSERNELTAELAHEEAATRDRHPISLGQTATNPRIWRLASIGLGHAIGAYSLNFWLPQQVKSLSAVYTNTTVGTLVTIPYFVALLAMVLISRSSDRRHERRLHATTSLFIGGIGFIGANLVTSPVASLACLSAAALGIYGFLGPFYAAPSEFLTGSAAAAGIALIASVSNLGGFIGPYLVGAISRRSGNLTAGMAVAGGAMLVSGILLLLLTERPNRVGVT
jgi:sugar phosphate permease